MECFRFGFLQLRKQEIQRATSISNIVRLKIIAFAPNIEPFSDHFLGPWELQNQQGTPNNNQIVHKKKIWNKIRDGFLRNWRRTLLFLEFSSLIVPALIHTAPLLLFPPLRICGFRFKSSKHPSKSKMDKDSPAKILGFPTKTKHTQFYKHLWRSNPKFPSFEWTKETQNKKKWGEILEVEEDNAERESFREI